MTSHIEIECFYRLLPEMHSLGCDVEADFHYSPYEIFVMETRLYPLIFDMFPNIDIELFFRGIYSVTKNRMVMHLEFRELVDSGNPYDVNKPFLLSDDQVKKIKLKMAEITSVNEHYALIDVNELYKNSEKEYPLSYLKNLLPYTGLTSEYNPFVRPEGIYLRFNPDANFNQAYYQVVEYILDIISDFYKRGVVLLNNIIDGDYKQKLINDWKLERVDLNINVGELYEPIWEDYRFSRNIVDFLLGKIAGDPYIRFRLSDNLVKRHFIIKNIQNNNYKLIIESSILKVLVDNLDQALEVAALVTNGDALGKGRVLVIGANRPSWIYLFFDYTNQKYGESLNIASYLTNNNETPYIFSVVLPEDEYSSINNLKDEYRNYALDRLIDVSKVTKLRNMSPHEIIEKEYQK